MQDFFKKAEGKTVGILNKKNIFDKGSKIKLTKDSHEIVETEGYNQGCEFDFYDQRILFWQ